MAGTYRVQSRVLARVFTLDIFLDVNRIPPDMDVIYLHLPLVGRNDTRASRVGRLLILIVWMSFDIVRIG